jgi:hypothetical protein
MTLFPHANPVARAVPSLPLVITLALAGCGGGGGPAEGTQSSGPMSASPGAATQVPGSSQQVEKRIGDTSVYAVAMPTVAIPAAVASEHGIERREDVVMLRVSGRRGESGSEAAVPLQVKARVADLRGQVQALEMKEQQAAGLLDYVGTVETQIPDTLRFEIEVTTPSGARDTLQLTREVQPGLTP